MQETIIFILEIVGTIAFAMSGAVVAIEKKMDILGVTILGVTTAVGGGIFRDIVLGNTPPQAFMDPIYLILSIFTSALMFVPQIGKHFRSGNIKKSVKEPLEKPNLSQKTNIITTNYMPISNKVLTFADSVGLSIFTVIGMDVAYQMSANSFVAIFVGVATGVAGGAIRDIMAQKPPSILTDGFYASAAIIGAIIAAIMHKYCDWSITILVSTSIILILRVLAARFGWSLPKS